MPYFNANGHQLFYREQGSGEVLIVLPGNTASSALHEGDLARLSARYHAVSLDFLGTGQSERVASWPDDWWQQGGRDAVALIDHLGAEQAILMGTSGGAVAALWGAILFPDRVKAVIADSCGSILKPEFIQQALAIRQQYTHDQVNFYQTAHGEDWRAVIEADNEILRRLEQRGGQWFEDELAKIRCPVLFTGSLRDPFYPELGDQLAAMCRQIPGSMMFLAEVGSHPLIWSAPGVFYRAVEMFLSQP